MQVQVSGKHVELGDALRTRVIEELNIGIGRYFERGGEADVVVSREGHLFRVDVWVRLASGQTLVSHAFGADAHSAFSGALDRIEARVRRYKRKLKNHHLPSRDSSEATALTVLRGAPLDLVEEAEHDNDEDGPEGPPAPIVIAETEAPLRTLTVSAAVLELELSRYPVILFRNAAHGGLSVVYRRPDGNIGWIDPERTRKTA